MKDEQSHERDIKFILENLTRPIVLIGMMGAGKSHVGRKLADLLGLPFADSDRHIEAAAGGTVSEIFTRDGEERFRAAERRVICDLLNPPLKVIATGGGAIMNPETAADIKENAVSIWLNADTDTLERRIGSAKTRPMLAGKNVREVLEGLLKQREPVYKKADITIDSGDTGQVIPDLVHKLAVHLGQKTGA